MTYIPDRRDYKPIRTDEQSQKQFEALETNTTQRALSPQPAPGAEGEWRLSEPMVNRAIADGIRGGANITAIDVVYDARRKHYGQIVVFDNPELAAKIISDHTLAASVPKLVDTLGDILREAEFVADAKAPFSTWVAEKCRAALAQIQEKQ